MIWILTFLLLSTGLLGAAPPDVSSVENLPDKQVTAPPSNTQPVDQNLQVSPPPLLALLPTELPRYGATPQVLSPFKGFSEPFWTFFQPDDLRLPERVAPPADSSGEIPIGLLVSGTGSTMDRTSDHMHRGVTLAFEQFNRREDTGGRRVRLEVKLALPIWGAASNAMVDLCLRRKVKAVIGAVDAADSHIALRVALKTEIPMINTATTDPTLTETGIPWILRSCVDDRQYGYALALLAIRNRGLKRLALLRANNNYGRKGVPEFIDACRRLGRPIAMEMRFNPGTRDLEQQIRFLEHVRADGIVIWANPEDGAHIVRELRRLGLAVPLFGSSEIIDTLFLDLAGGDAEGLLAVTDLCQDEDDPTVREFKRSYQERFKEEADAIAARAYDGARILLDAVSAARGDSHEIMNALLKLKGQTVRGVLGDIRLDSTLNNVGKVHVARVNNGKFVFIEPEEVIPAAGVDP